MKGTYTDKVLENVHFLSQNTRSLYHIMRSLQEKGVLTSREAKSIMLLPDVYTRSYDLYHNMVNKGEETCRILLEVWTDTGNDELTKKVVRSEISANDENSNQGNIFKLIGEEHSLKSFKSLPAEVQSVSQLLQELHLIWVEIDAYTFPKAMEKCGNLQKLTLDKVKITGLFPTKIRLEYLNEFHLNLIGGKINYHHDVTDPVRFLLFFDTKNSVLEPNWGLNGENIWKQKCDIVIADDGKVLLASFPKRKSLTASSIDAQSILQDVNCDLENSPCPESSYNLKTTLSDITTYIKISLNLFCTMLKLTI